MHSLWQVLVPEYQKSSGYLKECLGENQQSSHQSLPYLHNSQEPEQGDLASHPLQYVREIPMTPFSHWCQSTTLLLSTLSEKANCGQEPLLVLLTAIRRGEVCSNMASDTFAWILHWRILILEDSVQTQTPAIQQWSDVGREEGL